MWNSFTHWCITVAGQTITVGPNPWYLKYSIQENKTKPKPLTQSKYSILNGSLIYTRIKMTHFIVQVEYESYGNELALRFSGIVFFKGRWKGYCYKNLSTEQLMDASIKKNTKIENLQTIRHKRTSSCGNSNQVWVTAVSMSKKKSLTNNYFITSIKKNV